MGLIFMDGSSLIMLLILEEMEASWNMKIKCKKKKKKN